MKHWTDPFPGALFGALLLARLAVGLTFPLPVSGDEAYYWDWGRQLAWGYYSKPPLIGWLMRLSEEMIGGEAGIRIFATIFATTGLAAWTWLGTRIGGVATGRSTLLLLSLSPAAVALGLLLTIDAPLFAFTAVATAAAWRMAEAPDRSLPGTAAAFAIAMALAHLSKQMGWILPPLLLAALALSGSGGRMAARRLLLPSLLSYLVLIPTLLWNASNHWPLLGHTLSHFSSGGASFGRQVARFLEFLGSQLGLVTPVTFLLILAALGSATRRWRSLPPLGRFLLVLSLPGMLVFLGLALRQRVNPNWPLLFYPPAILLLVQIARDQAGYARWIPRAILIGGVFAAVTAVAPITYRIAGLESTRVDAMKRLRGWPVYAETVVSFNQNLPGGSLPIIVAAHRYYIAELAFYGPGHPSAARWEYPGLIRSQYEIWPIPEATIAGPALLVLPDPSGECPEPIRNSFTTVEALGTHRFAEGTGPTEGLSFFRVTGWRDLPGLPVED